ncbi:BTAD domain-containing putative transcriptional regulator [Promicromonospora sp. NPDC019610]|uniref:BTAD domain-containing putative transcriptional regulator n=1 Tax=Promicromonospora sp. NPDC019610 TaxID=3364405 RepID=UPI00379A0AC0
MPSSEVERVRESAGELLRRHREAGGLTQRDLAEASGVSLASVRDIEQGRSRRPRRESVAALVAALGLTGPEADRLRERFAEVLVRSRHDGTTASPGAVHISVLGPLLLHRGGARIPLRSRMQQVLLAELAVAAGSPVPREALVAALWPGETSATTAALNIHLTRLRRLLEDTDDRRPVVEQDRAGIRLLVPADQLDLLRFRELAAHAHRSGATSGAKDALAAAVSLWRGGPDPDLVTSPDRVAAVEEEYVAALLSYARITRELGVPEDAVVPLTTMAVRRPLDEVVQASLIQTLAAAGRQAEAFSRYESTRRSLATELGVDPGERLRTAHLDALRQRWTDESAAAASIPWQVPAAPPRLVGRAAERSDITAALDRGPAGAHVPVVVSGAAGVGKTALCLSVAHETHDRYPDGQLFADLQDAAGAPVPPLEILQRFLRATGPGTPPADLPEAASLFRSRLADRTMLIVLDNARDAAQVRPLIPGLGDSDVLVTSRNLLPELDSATLVRLDVLDRADSVRLLASATTSDGDDAAVLDELARLCSDLPLALQITAAQLRSRRQLAPADLVHRLRDGQDRLDHLAVGTSSLWNSFELSYTELSPTAQRVFRMSSLHPGIDFGTEATEVLVGDGTAARALDELLDANMLTEHAADRFRSHDLLRLFARRKLTPEDRVADAESRLRHWYLDRATAAVDWIHPHLLRLARHPDRTAVFADEDAAMRWTDLEYPSMLALATSSADDPDRGPEVWRLVDQLRGYLLLRRFDSWEHLAEAGLRAAVRTGDDQARAAMYISRSYAHWAHGRIDESHADTVHATRLAELSGWTDAVSYLAHNVGWEHYEAGRLVEAAACFEQMLSRTGPASQARALALNGLGMTCLEQGELARSADSFRAAIRISEGNKREVADLTIRGNLASALRLLGDTETAETQLHDVLHGFRQRGHTRGELSTLDELGRLLAQTGRPTEAVETAREAHAAAFRLNDPRAQVITGDGLGVSLLASGQTAEAAAALADAAALATAHGYRSWEARARAHLASAHLQLGNAQEATDEAARAVVLAETSDATPVVVEARWVHAQAAQKRA